MKDRIRARFSPQRSGTRVKTPTVIQMEAVECGAAALGIVLGYYGLRLPLEELRVACGVSRDGTKASNVLRAARAYGLDGKGYRKEPEQLRALRLPLIVFWNFNHFLVVEGFGKGQVYVNDPASGPRSVTDEEFDQAFTGVVLAVEPGPDFRPGGKQRSLRQSLRGRLTGTRAALTFLVLASLLLVLVGLIIPAFMRVFVDSYLVGGTDGVIGPLLAGLAAAAGLVAVLTWIQQTYLLRLETHLALTTSSKFFWHLLRLPIEFFSQRFSGDLSNRVMLNDRVAQLLSGDVATTVVGLVLVVAYVGLMARYDLLLTTISVAVMVLNLLVLRYIARRRTDQNQRLSQEQAKLAGTTLSGLQLIETLKASGGEDDFFARWAGYQAKVMNAEQELGLSTQLLAAFPPLLTVLNSALILTIGGMRVMSGHLSIGTLVAFQVLMFAFMVPVNQLVAATRKIQEAEADLNRLDDVLGYPAVLPARLTADDDRRVLGAAKLGGNLELRDVSFGYSRLEPPLIENLSLVLRPGARVALVGGSGSGKSTVAKLVAGLYAPWSGEILFDGQPRDALPRDVLQNSLSIVDQDIFLFGGSIRENLVMWDGTVAETSVRRAAADAAIHDEISNRPGGYDYVLEEGGRDLSGGQRQRLEIARALATNPTILLLDEATSALDPVTEKLIDDQLRQRGCTCLIVAHRLSTIRDCDEIVVLERGKVVQRGTHEEMRQVDGPYARLIGADEPVVEQVASGGPA